MQTATHLHFKGNCSEAFKFYAETFGGQIVFALTVGASPCARETPPEFHDKILHARLDFGGQMLLGCDALCDYQAPRGFNVMAGVDDRADAERIFNALAADGTVTMPFQETFWARGFGMCTDRFGTPWMVNCAKPQDALAVAA
ncbi:MAG TPA: VOC family protein [Steroidobacteraceae bacterium]|jgi:PhnB protein|nr:VOC family protein [Steroidobacteraceae bacterium]